MSNSIHLTPDFLPITQNWLYDLFSEISFPLVYSMGRKNREKFPYENIQISTSKLPGILEKIERNTKYYYNLNKEIFSRKEKVIIHSHFGNKGFKDSNFILSNNYKHVVSFYGYDISILLQQKKWIKRYNKLADKVDKFLVLGAEMKDKLLKIGVPEEKIQIFHLGVNVNKLDLNLITPNKKIKFLIASTFNKKKGIPDAIKAYNEYYKKNQNIELKIVGDIPTKTKEYVKYKNKITNMVENSKASNTIEMLGYIPYERLTEQISKAHFLLHPSITEKNGNQEGTPITIVNAMALGTLVLSTIHSDIPEIISNGEEGILVEERDYIALAEKIEKCVNDVKFYNKLVMKARDKVEKKFNIKKQANKLLNIYETL